MSDLYTCEDCGHLQMEHRPKQGYDFCQHKEDGPGGTEECPCIAFKMAVDGTLPTHGPTHNHPAYERCGGDCPNRRASILRSQQMKCTSCGMLKCRCRIIIRVP